MPRMSDNALPTRLLGDLEVSALGFGAMVLSPGVYGEIDDARAERALLAAVDAGATLIDTSDGYGADGHNERLIGTALGGRRDEVVIATKFGFRLPEGVEPHSFPVGYAFGELAVNADPKHVRGYAEASLRELGTDRIDLYYPHFPDPQVPLEDTVGAVAELIEAGLVRHLGLSNVTAAQLRAAHAVHPVAAVQTEWSMWRHVDEELLAVARELGVGVVAWSPLGAGFLTGKVAGVEDGDFRQHMPRFDAANHRANNDRFAPVRGIAEELGITPAQLALAWLLDQDDHVVPIPGSRTPAHIRENLAAARVRLSGDVRDRLAAVLAETEVAGGTLL
ncbi:aldo/keto reductase [Streptomyces sp. WAC05374]|nr:aldo/keto reductase [Streptomyces sp. WAC05374]TDF40115.1 aldo/keto reductase [Streptomyces sp. WAC05374]TDF48030.1 aldo/keto reductase [Streptomyces sp. WAC05374]TDF60076.1 aldo/keto reductase [Streptomyces sp. WAC05374]